MRLVLSAMAALVTTAGGIWLLSLSLPAKPVLPLSDAKPAPPRTRVDQCERNATERLRKSASATEYDIYRSLVEVRNPTKKSSAIIVVLETVSITPYLESLQRIVRDLRNVREYLLDASAVQGLRYQQERSSPLDRTQLAGSPITVATPSEISAVFNRSEGDPDGEWALLGGASVVRFSRVGLSCDLGQAILYLSETCGTLCGSGRFVILERSGKSWMIVHSEVLWVS